MHFENRVALVTGAAGGIGGVIARAFAAEGAAVALADRVPLESLAGGIRESGGRCLELRVDVSDSSSVRAAVARTAGELGAIDVLVNCAGVTSFGSAADLDEQEWERVLAINLKGSFLFAQAVIPPMRGRRFGRIINMGSVLGKNGGNARPWLDRAEQAAAANVAYGVSKAGVHAMTIFLARELAADGITVNAVAPGPIAGAMTRKLPAALAGLIPVGRLGEAGEVARAVLFLARADSGFITGEILDVNGGLWSD